jgi:hypothetical protein
MGNRRLSAKSVAIVFVLIMGITISPLKSNAESLDNDQAHAVGAQSSSNTGLLIAGAAVAGLLVYFFGIRDHNPKVAASTDNSCSNGCRICSSEKERGNTSILFNHESPLFLTAQTDSE